MANWFRRLWHLAAEPRLNSQSVMLTRGVQVRPRIIAEEFEFPMERVAPELTIAKVYRAHFIGSGRILHTRTTMDVREEVTVPVFRESDLPTSWPPEIRAYAMSQVKPSVYRLVEQDGDDLYYMLDSEPDLDIGIRASWSVS